jgi:hypothetical protein
MSTAKSTASVSYAKFSPFNRLSKCAAACHTAPIRSPPIRTASSSDADPLHI